MDKRFADMTAMNQNTIDLLESIHPTRPEDIAEHERQLSTARKLEALLAQVRPLLDTDNATI